MKYLCVDFFPQVPSNYEKVALIDSPLTNLVLLREALSSTDTPIFIDCRKLSVGVLFHLARLLGDYDGDVIACASDPVPKEFCLVFDKIENSYDSGVRVSMQEILMRGIPDSISTRVRSLIGLACEQ